MAVNLASAYDDLPPDLTEDQRKEVDFQILKLAKQFCRDYAWSRGWDYRLKRYFDAQQGRS